MIIWSENKNKKKTKTNALSMDIIHKSAASWNLQTSCIQMNLVVSYFVAKRGAFSMRSYENLYVISKGWN